MKRILITLIAFFYMATASGAGVSFHYCMGELVDWSVYNSEQHACEFCGMEKAEQKSTECCKDVKHQAKVDQAQKASVLFFKFENSIADMVLAQPLSFVSPVASVYFEGFVYANAPPISAATPIFIKNCTYRI